MINPIAQVLDEVGLYKPLKHLQRYVTDSRYRKNRNELEADLIRTRREVASWAAQSGGEVAEKGFFGIVSFTNLPMHAKFHCLAAKAMQLRGYKPIIFTRSSGRHGHKYFGLFGIRHLVMWDEWVRNEGPPGLEVEALVNSLLGGELSVSQAMQITFHGVDVGKHALSMTCRKRVEGRLNLTDSATCQLFKEQFRLSVQSVLAAEQFLDKYPLKKLLVRDSGYTPNGEIYEVALNRGVDCVVFEFGQKRSSWVFKRYTRETKTRHYFSLANSTWEQLKKQPWTAAEDGLLDREFSGRYRSDSTDDTRRLQSGKKLKSPEEVRSQLGLDPAKKTAVIFSHVAWDATFFYGTCLFDDFEDWLFQTVRFVAEHCPHLNWVVKVHPFNVFKLQRETVTETSEMRLLRPLFPLPDHVRILHADTDINTQSLFPVVDYVLTVNGTVGMEFPCFGIPSLVAGTGRYNGFGFTIEPKTREAYFDALRSLNTVPRLNAKAVQLARQHFYYLILGKQVSFEDVAPMELKRLHEAQSDVHDNIHITAKTLAEFATSSSIQRLGDWLAETQDPDLISLGASSY